jgi:hypothetical protein
MDEKDIEKLAFVSEQILRIRQWLKDSQMGTTKVVHEGFEVDYNRKQALEELQYWENEEKKLDGRKKPAIRPMDFSRTWES